MNFFSIVWIIIGLIFIIKVIVEPIHYYIYDKPLWVHFYFFPKKLNATQKEIIQANIPFYNRLKPKYKTYFEHRIHQFVNHYQFVGNLVEISDEMKVLIASVYVKLTFGYKKYLAKSFKTIIIYPSVYYSTQNNQQHKGEFNPKLKVVVFSWDHFLEGINVTNDNLNLGLHEFTHIIHFESKRKSRSREINHFSDNLNELFQLLENNALKDKILQSNFFRAYAFENQYEFVAVLLEHFFESPSEFKTQFPEIYTKVKLMINYNENRFSS